MNIILLFALALIDAILYGYLYEQKHIKGILFWELSFKGRIYVPVYRLLQGILDLNAIYLIYITDGLIPLIGFVIAWYCMLKEYLYYVYLWQWQGLLNLETYDNDVYWLKRFYFSGWWLFRNGFRFSYFTLSAFIGLAILIISNLI